MEKLYEKLENYKKDNIYPFHMPGHKRNLAMLPKWNPYEMDITEIDGFDSLHDANDILKGVMDGIAQLRGAEESFLLINGTTCGLLAGIRACVKHGAEVLVARNCHKSVYHGILLNGLVPHYIYPPIHSKFGANGGISPKKIEEMLITHPKIQLVIITSPTYEGVASDVKEIAKVVHKAGIPLLVDQAHGAHFGMEDSFPQSAIQCGADLVVESVHKTLPAFTQTALLHVQGKLVDKERVKKCLGIYETTSPSYPLMAGIEWCEAFCERERYGAFLQYANRLQKLRKQMEQLTYIQLMCKQDMCGSLYGMDYDMGKLVFGAKNGILTGKQLYQILLEEYGLQMEMASLEYVIAMTSVMDTEEGFQRLLLALQEIDQRIGTGLLAGEKQERDLSSLEEKETNAFYFDTKEEDLFQTERVYTPFETENFDVKMVELEDSKERIAGDFVYLYPPGIPLLVPGERISKKLLGFIKECMEKELPVKGIVHGKITVVVERNTKEDE